MLKIILPTAEIVSQFKNYEPIFCFYQDGIKSVVRDVVLLTTGETKDEDFPSATDDLIASIIAQYELSIEQRHLENTYQGIYPQELLELVVQRIERMVDQMLHIILLRCSYEICKTRYVWVGDDLLTNISILDDPYVP